MKDKYLGWEYQKLFNYFSEEHDVLLLKSQMQEVISICAETATLLDSTSKKPRNMSKSREELMLEEYTSWLMDRWNPGQLHIPFHEEAPRAFLDMKKESLEDRFREIDRMFREAEKSLFEDKD